MSGLVLIPAMKKATGTRYSKVVEGKFFGLGGNVYSHESLLGLVDDLKALSRHVEELAKILKSVEGEKDVD